MPGARRAIAGIRGIGSEPELRHRHGTIDEAGVAERIDRDIIQLRDEWQDKLRRRARHHAEQEEEDAPSK